MKGAAERHAAAYRRLLTVYPGGFRREMGDAAVATFHDLCRAAERNFGRWGLVRLWLGTLPRLLWGGVAERVAEAGRAARSDAPVPGEVERPPWAWALMVGGLVFGLYALTLAPTTAFWDTSEYIATGHILGVPHPPGNPLFVVLARSWEILLGPLGLPVAVRTNLLSAFMSGAAHGLWFLVVHEVLGSFGRKRFFRLGGAFVAVLVSATAFTVWSQSNVNEKVYTVSLFTIALLSWLALRWRGAVRHGKGHRLLILMGFVLALSVGNHLMAFLAAPALLLFVLLVRPRTLLDWRLGLAVVVAGTAGLTIHLFLPIRAAMDPVINQGAPRCDSIVDALGSIVTWGRRGCQALSESLLRKQYAGPPGTPGPGTLTRQSPVGSQLLMYLQYFDWQWARSVQGVKTLLPGARLPFTMLFTGLGVWGAAEHHRRDRSSFWYVLVLFATLSVALTLYLNFQYGYSIPDPLRDFDVHEVRERDYFFLVSFSVWGLWAGMGLAAVWRWLSEEVVGSWIVAAPVLLLALIPGVLNRSWADRSYDWAARDWAYNLLESVEPYGVIFTAGDNDTFPLWYLQEVEGIRRDVTVIVTSYLNVPWYAKQLRDVSRPCPEGTSARDHPTRIVCQRDYRPGPRVAYTARPDSLAPGVVPLALSKPPRRPELPIMELDDATIDQVGRTWVPLQEARTVRVGPIRPVIPGGQYLAPWQQYALAIVDTAFADGRPVYWSSSGGSAASIGLTPYLYRQGLAYKVSDGTLPRSAAEGVVRLSGDPPLLQLTGRWVDVPRTETLLDRVFVHHSGIPWWDHWPDATTSGIPNYYAWAYWSLSLAADSVGDGKATERYLKRGDAWARLGQ